jgi:hypothetical protein
MQCTMYLSFYRSTTAAITTGILPCGRRKRHIITDPITLEAVELQSSRAERR